MNIDYERLKLVLASDIHVDYREDFDLDEIVNDATLNEEERTIMVKFSEGWFKYAILGDDDSNPSYIQIAGGGGIRVE
ncbi:hypothetical protein [Methanobacterium sp.]|uniref:hypothetical protein n=1 Tax=Methanobacterium sp. TaxID=2164 RepID=UPI003C774B5F